MQWTSAPNIAGAPLPQRARSYWKARISAVQEGLEKLLEAERAQLPPWFVVGLGSGIAAWFVLKEPSQWAAFLCIAAAFAAVTAIVALHSTGWVRSLFRRRDEGPVARVGRALLAMVVTGLVVELALIPLALFHFHRAGLYGVAANIIAIPLTTFVIMPLEAAALFLDTLGWGKPLWLLCGTAIDGLLRLAHKVASARGAVALLSSMPSWAFGLMIVGGLWLCLWTTRIRVIGVAPFLIGAVGAVLTPSPYLLVTGDRHALAETGGLAIYLGSEPRIDTVAERVGAQPGAM